MYDITITWSAGNGCHGHDEFRSLVTVKVPDLNMDELVVFCDDPGLYTVGLRPIVVHVCVFILIFILFCINVLNVFQS